MKEAPARRKYLSGTFLINQVKSQIPPPEVVACITALEGALLPIRTVSVGFVQSLYLSFLANVHIFLFYPHPDQLYSHSILLTKDGGPRTFFPFSHISGTNSWIACLSEIPSLMKSNIWVKWMLPYEYDRFGCSDPLSPLNLSVEKENIAVVSHTHQFDHQKS